MRVLNILPALTKGGAENVVINLCNELSDLGHEVDLLLFYPTNSNLGLNLISSHTSVSYISEKRREPIRQLLSSFLWVFNNRKILKGYDIIHAHLTMPSILASFIKIYLKLNGVKKTRVCETNHSVGMPISRWQKLLFNLSINFRDGYILIAESDEYDTLKSGLKSSIIKNGITKDMPTISDAESMFYNQLSQKINGTDYVVGTVSRLDKARSPYIFLKIFKKIIENIPDHLKVKFLIIGDGELREDCIKYSKVLGIHDKCIFTGLVTNPRYIIPIMNVYISLNVSDITGVAGIEAVLGGVPVVGYQMNSNYKVSKDDWIWSTQNETELAKMVIELLLSVEKSRVVCSNQKKYVMNNLDSTRMALNYEQFYKWLMA